jgi:cytochrome c
MSLEITKFVAGLLTALIVGIVGGLIGQVVVPVEKLAKDTYPIEVKEAAAAPAAAAPADDKPVPLTPEIFAKADLAKGEETAKKCAQCHNWEKGSGTKVGPTLYGVIGRARASVAGFGYSDALKGLGGTWTPQEIGNFIYKPAAYAPGTKMGFAGLPKTEDRADVIAYLNKQSDAPVDLTK